MKRLAVIFLSCLILLSFPGIGESKDHDFFVFEPDLRLFTTYAFMNAAGYDHDWNASMHPIRVEIRVWLDSVLSDEYKNKLHEIFNTWGGGDFYSYGVYALNLKTPPDSGLSCDPCNLPELDRFPGYDSLFLEFYRQARIEGLWNRYRDRILNLNLEYKPFADTALFHITTYCRVEPDFFQKKVSANFHYQMIPLMSYFTAFFYETEKDYWIVSGPSTGQPGPGGFYHESLHRIVNPIVERNQKLNKRIDDLVALSQEKLQGSYYGSYAMICESLVRTIDRILSTRYSQSNDQELYRMVEDEYKLGHILCFYFLENLPTYENSGKSLKDYYPKLIAGIDIEAEKDRWIKFWKK